MTILFTGYKTKTELKKSVGKELCFQETSLFGAEYPASGTGTVTGARRPHLLGGGREFFARVELKDHKIVKVS